MAQEIRQNSFVIAAGTTPAVPITQDLSFPPRDVSAIEIIVPPGPNGLVGFALMNSNVIVIPYDSDQWIITSDEKIHWDLSGYINSGSWQIRGYNLGVKPHTIYLRWLLNLTTAPPSTVPSAFLDTALING